MRIKTIGKVGFVVLLIGLVLFPFTGVAMAANGPTNPPVAGDPVGTNVSPHGGYSTSTDYCIQCHSVHPDTPTAGAYALLWKDTVTATCNTCHGLAAYGGAATGARNSNGVTGFSTGVMGTTSSRSAYDITTGVKASHPLYASGTTGLDNVSMQESGWSYHGSPATWKLNTQATDGLQCTSCHEAHGNFGQLVNSETGVVRTTANNASLGTPQAWAEGTAFYPGGGSTVKYLHKDTDADAAHDTVWEACSATSPAVVAGTVDTGCTFMTRTDSEGQTVSVYGYKLLSAYPNYDWAGGGQSWGLDSHDHDQALWCGTCHPAKVAADFGGTYHNHPTGCTACHGNPTSDTTSLDFPHTSTFGNFLKSYPDGLCITCHAAGSLP